MTGVCQQAQQVKILFERGADILGTIEVHALNLIVIFRRTPASVRVPPPADLHQKEVWITNSVSMSPVFFKYCFIFSLIFSIPQKKQLNLLNTNDNFYEI